MLTTPTSTAAAAASGTVFRRRGLLLIDDDLAFGKLMKRTAEGCGVPLTHYAALEDMPSVGVLGEYDIALLDYNLATFNGLEIAAYVDAFFGSLPVMLVSSDNLENTSCQRWPSCIRKFVNKMFGPYAILQRALKVLESQAPSDTVANRARG